MLPASLGAALAQKSRPLKQRGRTILFEGDGSFQVTAQEVSTIIRYKLDVTIFIVNNGGYAYERHIHGMEEDYNDIPP
jgi:pyruvate decarboxylase